MSESQAQSPQLPPEDGLSNDERAMQTAWRWIGLGLLIVAGLMVGLGISNALFPKPKIGIVRLYDVIDYSTAPYSFGQLDIAAKRGDIRAVVISVDSPGGYATVSENLFYTIIELRKHKPVVSSIESLGASGAYYAASASNFIIARPATDVGSIGVIASLPELQPPDEQTLITGPFKGGAGSTMDVVRGTQAIKQSFLNHVYEQRLYTLEHAHPESRAALLPPRDSLTTGQVWSGAEAYNNGLIDGLGSDLDAIHKAAELAGISNYDVIDLYSVFTRSGEEFYGYSAETAQAHDEWYQSGPWVEFYHIYEVPGR